MATAVADPCDSNFEAVQAGRIRGLPPGLVSFGGASSFMGRACTLKVFEDNSLVREELERDGSGKVLVVDGGSSVRCALFGGNLASLAARNKWSGVIVYGYVRDVSEIRGLPIDVRALGACPVKSVKKGQGERDVPVVLNKVKVSPGAWCYGDLDGVIVSDSELHLSSSP